MLEGKRVQCLSEITLHLKKHSSLLDGLPGQRVFCWKTIRLLEKNQSGGLKVIDNGRKTGIMGCGIFKVYQIFQHGQYFQFNADN